LKNFSYLLISMFPLHWVTFVDLKQHLRIFENFSVGMEFKDIALKLAVPEFRPSNSHERSLFSHFLKKGKVFFMFDGFDEISPKYNEIVTKILEQFPREGGNQLWITTRTHWKIDLENILAVPSYELKSFETKEKIDFLSQSCLKYSRQNGEELQKISEVLIKNLEELLDDKRLKMSKILAYLFYSRSMWKKYLTFGKLKKANSLSKSMTKQTILVTQSGVFINKSQRHFYSHKKSLTSSTLMKTFGLKM
jgi:hypothetical protein